MKRKTTARDTTRDNEPLVNSRVVALLLGVKDRTVRKWGEERIIPCYRVGSLLKYRMSEIQEWVAQNRFPSSEEIRREFEEEKEERKEKRESETEKLLENTSGA